MSPVASDKCARWILDLPNFVKAYQTSKTPSSCLGAGQIFVRCEIWQIYLFTRHHLKENVNQEKFQSESWSPKIQNVAVEQCEASTGIVEVETAYAWGKRIQGRKNKNTSNNVPRQHIRSKRLKMTPEILTFPANSEQAMVFISVWLKLVVHKYFAVYQCAHA